MMLEEMPGLEPNVGSPDGERMVNHILHFLNNTVYA